MLQPEGSSSQTVPQIVNPPSYQGDEVKPGPLCNGTPQEQIALESRQTSSRNNLVKCAVQGCDKVIKLSEMRLHVGAHILRGPCGPANGMTPSNAEACGFCGIVCAGRNSGVCKVELIKGTINNSAGPIQLPFSLQSVLQSCGKGFS